MPSRRATRFFVMLLLLYALCQVLLFFYPFAIGYEPDFITLFKMLCILIIFSSSIITLLAIKKEIMFVILSSEIMLITAGFGLLLYTVIYSIIFYRNWNWSSINFRKTFFIFVVQRVTFFAIFLPSVCVINRYRIKRTDMLDLDKWSIDEIIDIPLGKNQQIKKPYTAFPDPNNQPPYISPMTLHRPRLSESQPPPSSGGVNLQGSGFQIDNDKGKDKEKEKGKDNAGQRGKCVSGTPGKIYPVGGDWRLGHWVENEENYSYVHPEIRPIIHRSYGGIAGASPSFLPRTFYPLDQPTTGGKQKPYKNTKIPISLIAPEGYPVYPLPSPHYPHYPHYTNFPKSSNQEPTKNIKKRFYM